MRNGPYGLVAALLATGALAQGAPPDNRSWQATGTLFESCSCAVPCPCNFGQPPTHSYCHTIYAYRLKTARYGGVELSGLAFGGGEGDQGRIGFLDARATAAQRVALERLALAVFSKGGASSGSRRFLFVSLRVDADTQTFSVKFGESGGFAADVLTGGDGKTPVIVENNTTWPVHRFIKGKTSHFEYHDAVGNRMRYDGVNANIGDFSLDGTVPAAR